MGCSFILVSWTGWIDWVTEILLFLSSSIVSLAVVFKQLRPQSKAALSWHAKRWKKCHDKQFYMETNIAFEIAAPREGFSWKEMDFETSFWKKYLMELENNAAVAELETIGCYFLFLICLCWNFLCTFIFGFIYTLFCICQWFTMLIEEICWLLEW